MIQGPLACKGGDGKELNCLSSRRDETEGKTKKEDKSRARAKKG